MWRSTPKPLFEAFRSWLTVERGLRPATIQLYAAELSRLHRTCGPVDRLEAADLRAYLVARAGSPSSYNQRLAALRCYYGWLVLTERRDDDPTARIGHAKTRRSVPKQVQDPSQTLARLAERKRTHYLAAVFLLETGLRISEAMAVSEAMPIPESIVVEGKGGRERRVWLTPLAQATLAELGGRMPKSKSTIQRWMREVGVTPHRWRHTLAYQLGEAGVDLGVIQDILGHSSPATTRIYQENSSRRLRAAQELRGTMLRTA